MLKVFVEEAVALASITLFVGMIAVWRSSSRSSDQAAPKPGRAWAWGKAGGHAQVMRSTWTSRAPSLTIEGRVGLSSGFASQA